jgi:hypothetical protein
VGMNGYEFNAGTTSWRYLCDTLRGIKNISYDRKEITLLLCYVFIRVLILLISIVYNGCVRFLVRTGPDTSTKIIRLLVRLGSDH